MTKDNEEKARLDGRHVRIYKPFLLDVQEGRYTPNDLLFFSAVKMMSNVIDRKEIAIISVDVLLALVGFAKHNRNKKLALESLNNLIEGRLIKVYRDIGLSDVNKDIALNDILYIKITEKPNGNDKYTQLRHFEFNDIVASGERNPAKMLLLYCAITVEIFEKGDLKQTNISNETLAKNCGLDIKTVTKYIKKLEEIRVMYRKLVKFQDEDNVTKTKNIFTRYDWSNYIESRYL